MRKANLKNLLTLFVFSLLSTLPSHADCNKWMNDEFPSDEPASLSLQEKLVQLITHGDFLFHPEQAADRLVKEVSLAPSPSAFTASVRFLLATKSSTHMGGLADGYFAKAVFPRLLKLSEQYKLTDADRTSISTGLNQMHPHSSAEPSIIHDYSVVFWGSVVNGDKLDELVTDKNFLHHSEESAQRLIEQLSLVTSGDDFTDSVCRILGTKSKTYMGGLADGYFAKNVFPLMLKLSENYSLTRANQIAIQHELRAMKTYSVVEPSLASLYANSFWGKISNGEKLDELVTNGDFLLHPDLAAKRLIHEVTQTSSATEFTDSILRLIGTKSKTYMGGLADGYFAQKVFPVLLKSSEQYRLTDQNRSSIRDALKHMTTHTYTERSVVETSSQAYWGSLF